MRAFARGSFGADGSIEEVELPHPAAGTVPVAASPLKFSGSPVEYRRAPPMLGEHTEQVLSEKLGLSAEEIQALAQSRV